MNVLKELLRQCIDRCQLYHSQRKYSEAIYILNAFEHVFGTRLSHELTSTHARVLCDVTHEWNEKHSFEDTDTAGLLLMEEDEEQESNVVYQMPLSNHDVMIVHDTLLHRLGKGQYDAFCQLYLDCMDYRGDLFAKTRM